MLRFYRSQAAKESLSLVSLGKVLIHILEPCNDCVYLIIAKDVKVEPEQSGPFSADSSLVLNHCCSVSLTLGFRISTIFIEMILRRGVLFLPMSVLLLFQIPCPSLTRFY